MSYHRLRLLLVTKRDHWERHLCFNLVKDQLSWELAVSQTMQILTRLWIFQFHPLLRLLRGSRATGCFGYEVTLNPNYHQILVKCFFYNVKIQKYLFWSYSSFFLSSVHAMCCVIFPFSELLSIREFGMPTRKHQRDWSCFITLHSHVQQSEISTQLPFQIVVLGMPLLF